MDQRRELARQRAAGAAGRGLGAGVDQVGYRLGLGQVDLVVQKGPLAEFTRPRQPQTQTLAKLQAARHQQLQHHRAAVGLQFQHVFAGVGGRRREVDCQALVDHAAVGGAEWQVMRLACIQVALEQGLNDGRQVRAGQAHDAHRAASGGGGDGNDGFGRGVQHGLALSVFWRTQRS